MVGVSDEVRALVRYLGATGIPHRVTTTTNHKAVTSAGHPSRHVALGTNGKGLAIDIAGPTPGRDTQALADIFNALAIEGHALHELIYAGPQVAFNIKSGRQVAKYATADHHDHVHVSVDKGVLLVPPHPPLDTIEEDSLMASLYKDRGDAEVAKVREFYLTLLGREPEDSGVVYMWIDIMRAQGVDAVYAGIADSDEGQARRAAVDKLIASAG